MKRVCIYIFLLLVSAAPLYPQIYVATEGSDTNTGTIDQPFGTIAKAITVAIPGDTIYVRGGEYIHTNSISISSSKSGSDSARYFLFAHPGERPVLNFFLNPNGRKGINFQASYWRIKGLDIKGAGDNGIEIDGGSFNIIENCSFYENRDSGVQLSNGAANNQIINCDSYYNADPPDYGDADGFAPKLTVGSGNYFYGCRAWGNVDDGWDGYMRGANDVTTTLENCWTWGNGYLKDGTDPGSQANGNGFKMGGGDNSNSDSLMHHFILKNCLAFNNKQKGFDQNNNVGSMTLLNCTGYNNKEANYRIQKTLNSGQTLTIKNCISFTGAVQLGSFAIQEANSWQSPFAVTSEDFVSIDPASASSPRKADGSLPDIDFMHLASGSDLIDAGVDLGRPFSGNAPDLGAFESGFTSTVEEEKLFPTDFRLNQNYPNPFNPETTIKFKLARSGFAALKIYNLFGQEIETLVNGFRSAGEYEIKWRPQILASGLYFYRLQAGDFSETKKLILQR